MVRRLGTDAVVVTVSVTVAVHLLCGKVWEGVFVIRPAVFIPVFTTRALECVEVRHDGQSSETDVPPWSA